MRIVEVGTFLLPRRLTLPSLMSGGRTALHDALCAEFNEFDTPPPLQSGGLVLDYHQSIGARQMDTMSFEGAIEHDGIGTVRLYVSSLSVGFVVVNVEFPDGQPVDLDRDGAQSTFKQFESALTESVSPLVAEWSRRIDQALRPEWTQERPPSVMAAGQLLWWHRIAIDPQPGSEFASARWFGVAVELGSDLRCSVGDGFTNIHGNAGPLIEQVAEGIMFATQEWMIVDEAQRLLAEHLLRLSQVPAGDLISVDGQYGELLVLTEEVTLRKLILSEEQRYLANTRTRVKEAASECWHMAKQAAELEGRTEALRDLFLLHRERITSDRDERRNALVFVLTAITLIQSALVWYDFLTEPNNSVSRDPRPTIALAVLGITLVVVLTVVWRQLHDRRRRTRLEIRRGLTRPSAAVSTNARKRA